MNCPECDESSSKVTDMRRHAAYIRRRRCCLTCDHRWTTTEVAQDAAAVILALEADLDEIRDAARAKKIFLKACYEYLGIEDDEPEPEDDDEGDDEDVE